MQNLFGAPTVEQDQRGPFPNNAAYGANFTPYENPKSQPRQSIPKRPPPRRQSRNLRRDSRIGTVKLLSHLETFLDKNKPPSLHIKLAQLSRRSKIFFNFHEVFKRHSEFHLRVCRLRALNSKHGHPFFKLATNKFLSSLAPPTSSQKGRSEFWCQPMGILKSLQLPIFAFFANFQSGFKFYDPQAENVFLTTKVHQSFLVNPPFSTKGEQGSDPMRFRPIFEHIKLWINIAYNSKKPMALVLPQLQKFPFYLKLSQRKDLAILHFTKPLVFARGANFELVGISPELNSILIVGIHFSPTEVLNNTFGNFVMKKKILSEANSIFNKFHFHDHSILKDFFSDSVKWAKRVHNLIYEKSPTFVYPEEIPSRVPFSLGKPMRNISNLENFRTHTVDVLDSRFFFPLEKIRKKKPHEVTLSKFIDMSKKQLILNKKKQHYCTECRKETHDTSACFLNPLSQRFLEAEDDVKIYQFLQTKRNWKATYLPNFQHVPPFPVLFKILKKIDSQASKFKAEFLQLGCTFSLTNTFSMLRNHLHFILAINPPMVDLMNFVLGFNPLLGFKNFDPPRIHVNHPKPNPETNALIWKQVFSDLKENKIFWLEKKDLIFCVPIFIIHQLNAFGQHKDRLINNFAPFSHLIKGVPFKLFNITHLSKFSRGAYVLVLDIKSCYPTLQLLFSNFFGFKCWSESDSRWEYFATKSPLFGVHYAPYMAFLALKFLIKFLASFGFFSSVYVDDIYIIIARAEENISEEVFFMRMKFIISIFVRVGLKLSTKMRIESTTFPLYTGVFFSTILNRSFPNPIKIAELQQLIFKAIDDKKVSLQLLTKIEGKTKWITKCRKYMFSRVISHLISRVFLTVSNKKLTKKQHAMLFGTTVKVTDDILSIFYLFFKEVNFCYLNPIKFHSQDFATLVTDASPNSAGFFLELPGDNFHFGSLQLNESWITQKFSSTHAELEALYLSIIEILPKLNEYNIFELLIFTDSNPLFLNMRNLGSKIPHNHHLLLRIKNLLNDNNISFELGWHPRSTIFAQTADFYTNNYLVNHFGLTTYLTDNFDLHGKLHIFNSTMEILRFTEKYFYMNNFEFTLNDILVFLLPVQFQLVEFYELISMLKRLHISFLVITPAERIQQKKNFMDTQFWKQFHFRTLQFPLEILTYPQAYKNWSQLVFWHFR